MHLNLKDSYVDYTYIGVTHSALFVELCSTDTTVVPIEKFYDEYMVTQPPAFIFHGALKENQEALSWLIPKLLSSGCIVSLVTDRMLDLPSNQIIYVIEYNSMLIRKQVADCKSLRSDNRDCILIKSDSFEDIHKIYRALMVADINIPLYFTVSNLELLPYALNKGITFATPFLGKIGRTLSEKGISK